MTRATKHRIAIGLAILVAASALYFSDEADRDNRSADFWAAYSGRTWT